MKEQIKINYEHLTINYTTNNFAPYDGVSYYRLKQTDYDGAFSYATIFGVAIQSSANNQIVIYPNPTSNKFNIEGNPHELATISIYNILGENVTNQTLRTEDSIEKIIVDASRLSSGIYYIKTKTTANKVHKQ